MKQESENEVDKPTQTTEFLPSDGALCSPSPDTPETDAIFKRTTQTTNTLSVDQMAAVVLLSRKMEVERNGARSALDIFRDRIFDLEDAIHETLIQNLHLADGDICTLKLLKDAVGFELPAENVIGHATGAKGKANE